MEVYYANEYESQQLTVPNTHLSTRAIVSTLKSDLSLESHIYHQA